MTRLTVDPATAELVESRARVGQESTARSARSEPTTVPIHAARRRPARTTRDHRDPAWPQDLYRRGRTYWFIGHVGGASFRRSLRTRDFRTARRHAEDIADRIDRGVDVRAEYVRDRHRFRDFAGAPSPYWTNRSAGTTDLS